MLPGADLGNALLVEIFNTAIFNTTIFNTIYQTLLQRSIKIVAFD